jgi:hypothetical protein
MRRIATAGLLVTVLWAAASPAAAQESPDPAQATEQARAHFDLGTRLMQNENWEVALGEFERSFELFPTRSALFNMAMCEKALHRYVAALRHFEDWQQRFAAAATEDERRTVSATLDELSRFVGSLAIETTPRGATIRVDGTEVGTTPLADPLMVDAGDHVVEAVLDGHLSAREEVEVEPLADVEMSIALELQPPDVPLPPVGPPPGDETPVESSGVDQAWFWTTAGIAVAAGIGGAAAGGITLGKERDLNALGDRCQANDLDACARGTSLLAEYDDAQLATNVLLFGAGAFAVTALILAFVTDFDFGDGETPPVEVTAGPAGVDAAGSPTGVSLGLAVAF